MFTIELSEDYRTLRIVSQVGGVIAGHILTFPEVRDLSRRLNEVLDLVNETQGPVKDITS